MWARSRHCWLPRLVLNLTISQINSPLRGRRGRTVLNLNPAAVSCSGVAVAKFMWCLCVWLVYRVRGSATIPAGAFPTVTLEAAGIVIVGVHQVVVLTVLIEAVGLGVGVAVSEGSGCHGWSRLVDVVSLDAQGISQAPGRTLL